jgi:glycosyltransferase involved in cell wall biosynthesis
MSKASCVISCPIDTYSGYGARSRDFVKAVIEAKPDWDIQIMSQRWGNTRFGYLDDHKEFDLKSRIIPAKLTKQPDVWMQITVPNEFQKVGKYNIGVTAGIETTVCDAKWIDGCNRMDMILTSSNHSKDVFEKTIYTLTNNQTGQKQDLRLTAPVKVLFEGLRTDTYFKTEEYSGTEVKETLDSIKESFCYLVVGHWMQGNFGHDRKNIGYTIKAFLETFKNKSDAPALLLKTHTVGTSIMDRETILDKIDQVRKTVKGVLPNIYLLHGEMTDSEINDLYNHPKVKAMVSLNKGEGFGRPLLEFTATGKPVIASGWSGQLDFLHREYSFLVGGDLENVHESAEVKETLLKESKWFKPDDNQVGTVLKDSFKNYKKYLTKSRKHRKYTIDNFSYEKMVELVDSIFTENVPEFAQQVELNLPKLKLPKLQKIDG